MTTIDDDDESELKIGDPYASHDMEDFISVIVKTPRLLPMLRHAGLYDEIQVLWQQVARNHDLITENDIQDIVRAHLYPDEQGLYGARIARMLWQLGSC